MINSVDTEPARRVAAALLQWGGWLGATGIFVYATAEFDPNHGKFAPQWVGFAFIAALVVGVAGTLVCSRFRLGRTMVSVFTQGRAAQRRETDERVQEVVRRQDELITKLDAYVQAAEVRRDVAQRQQEILDKLEKLDQ